MSQEGDERSGHACYEGLQQAVSAGQRGKVGNKTRLVALVLCATGLAACGTLPPGATMSQQMGGATASQIGGELPGHPHTKSVGSAQRPVASRQANNVDTRGDMSAYPPRASSPAGRTTTSGRSPAGSRMNGDMGDHPHLNSTLPDKPIAQ